MKKPLSEIKGRKQKCFDIIDVHVSMTNTYTGKINALCNALYISSKGTNHFFEALDLIQDINEEYREEFQKLKTD